MSDEILHPDAAPEQPEENTPNASASEPLAATEATQEPSAVASETHEPFALEPKPVPPAPPEPRRPNAAK